MRNRADAVYDGDFDAGDEQESLALCSEKFGKSKNTKQETYPILFDFV